MNYKQVPRFAAAVDSAGIYELYVYSHPVLRVCNLAIYRDPARDAVVRIKLVVHAIIAHIATH